MASKVKSNVPRLSVSEAREALKLALARSKVETEKRNKAFRNLSRPKQRLTIAHDVLDQIESRRFQAKFGVYLQPKEYVVGDKFDSYSNEYDSELSVQEALADSKCEVCGIGSLFVAAVDRVNECTVGELDGLSDSSFMRSYLSDWFDEEQLRMIEAAFEGRDIGGYADHYPEHIARAIAFTKKLTSAEGRLKKIMRNIIDNHGEFTP